MDIALVSAEYPDIPVGRPILYVIIDVLTDLILGVSLAMDNNSVVGLTNCFANLVEDKQALIDSYCPSPLYLKDGITIDDVWPTNVKPQVMKFDNGSDFISSDISRILKELDIDEESVPKGTTGSMKPLVENFFKQWCELKKGAVK